MIDHQEKSHTKTKAQATRKVRLSEMIGIRIGYVQSLIQRRNVGVKRFTDASKKQLVKDPVLHPQCANGLKHPEAVDWSSRCSECSGFLSSQTILGETDLREGHFQFW